MAAFERLENWSLLSVEGPDAASFLDGQLTQKIADMDEHSWRLTTHVNTQGRALGLFFVFKTPQGFLLLSTQDSNALCLKHLQHYARFSRVHFQSLNAQILFDSAPRPMHEAGCVLTQGSRYILTLAEQRGSLHLETAEQPTLGISGYRWAYVCYQFGWMFLTEPQLVQYLPHDLGYVDAQAVHFRKGCFTGQEIVARMHYKAKHTKQLVRLIQPGLSAPDDFAQGLSIPLHHQEQRSGTLLSCLSLNGQGYALAILLPQPENAPNTFEDAGGKVWQLDQRG